MCLLKKKHTKKELNHHDLVLFVLYYLAFKAAIVM